MPFSLQLGVAPFRLLAVSKGKYGNATFYKERILPKINKYVCNRFGKCQMATRNRFGHMTTSMLNHTRRLYSARSYEAGKNCCAPLSFVFTWSCSFWLLFAFKAKKYLSGRKCVQRKHLGSAILQCLCSISKHTIKIFGRYHWTET
jgi:hypothetical protein